MVNALREAQRLKFDTVQVFTKNQRQWRAPPLHPDVERDWLAELERLGWTDRTVSHASYLINMASPDAALRRRSIDLMREEIERCERLRIPWLVAHPGAHLSETERGAAAGRRRIAAAIAKLMERTRGYRTTLCLENVAGAGTTVGRTFEELAEIASDAADRSDEAAGRIGFCLDTCHALAAGFDIRTPRAAENVLEVFDEACGLDRLRVLHLNDSKGGLGSRKDRHEHIGDGRVGKAGFWTFVNNPVFADVPKILETPKGETPKGTPWDSVNLRRLRRLERQESPPR